MAVNIPTYLQIYIDIINNLETQFGVQISSFGKVWLRAQAATQAGKLWLYYKAIANVQKNIFVDTAESEIIGGTLERFGRVKLGRSPFTAKPGSYEVNVTGDTGALIKANTIYKSNDDSLNPAKLFVLDNNYNIIAGLNTITLRALEGGLDSKLDVGNGLTATAPIANVDSGAVVSSESIVPLASESLEDYRDKTIEAYQLEPQGGAGVDYRLWSKDAQGVKEVYPYAKAGASNELQIFIEANIADSTDGKGTPTPLIIANVAAVVEFDPDISKPLNERGRRPLGVFNIDFLAISVLEIDIEITSFANPTPAKEASILAALTSRINKIRPFVSSSDILSSKDDILDKNLIISEILTAEPGSVFGAIILKVNNVSVNGITFIDGNIPHLNTVVYV